MRVDRLYRTVGGDVKVVTGPTERTPPESKLGLRGREEATSRVYGNDTVCGCESTYRDPGRLRTPFVLKVLVYVCFFFSYFYLCRRGYVTKSLKVHVKYGSFPSNF